MAQRGIFNLPNAQAKYFADTGREIGIDTRPRLGSATGPAYSPTAAPALEFNPAPVGPTTSESFNLLRKTKNPGIETANMGLLGRIGTTSAANQGDLAKYTSKLLGLQPAADAAFNQEARSIEDVFSGKLAADLAGARDRYAMGARQATQQAVADANAARKSASIGSGVGGSSYFNRQAIAAGIMPGAKLAADLADRESRDLAQVRAEQNRLLGARNRLGTEMASSLLLPASARSSLMRDDIANLGGVANLDQANNFYGLADQNPATPFSPVNYPVGGPTLYGGSVSGGGVLGPVGGNSAPARPYANSRLISALAAQEQAYARGWSPRSVTPAAIGIRGNVSQREANLPTNYYDLDEGNQTLYDQMLAAAAQYQGNYE